MARAQRKTFAEIPAARQLPVVGTKLDFALAGAGRKLHAYIDQRHRSLGPVFREALGPAELVFVSCPKAMRELFKYEGKYPKHPLPESWTMYNEAHSCKRGLFFMDDEEWLHNRQIMNTLMLHTDSQQPVRKVILQSCAEFVTGLDELLQQQPDIGASASVEVPDLINMLYAWSVRSVSAVVLGDIANGTQLRPLIDDLSAKLHMLFEDSAPLMSFPPRLAQKLRLNIWTKYERTVTEIMAMANEIADIALCQTNAMDRSSCLLAAMSGHGMSEDMIKRIFIDLILAAGDTTAYTTQWTLYLLARNGATQRLVREDAQKSDNLESVLIRGAVRESMRLYPMAFLIGRLMNVDAVIEDYEIPKNTMVLASLYTAGRSADNYPSPDQFQPWRWTRDSNGKFASVIRPGASIPYALGARSCVGQKVANIQMHYLLTSILREFELTLLNEKEVDVEIKVVMVPSEKIRIGIQRCHRIEYI